MGCAGSSRSSNADDRAAVEMSSGERAIKAAILIQKWYRRYMARQEIRRRCSWSIFQSLEYAGEQDQIKLSNFFNDLIIHLADANSSFAEAVTKSPHQSIRGRPSIITQLEQEDAELLQRTNPQSVHIDSTKYKGPHLKLPMTTDQITLLIKAFKEKKLLHAKFVLLVLHEARKILRSKPNISQASTVLSRKITVCGDLHGQLDDLTTIFYKNGLPGRDNPYVFNGDFVDRGVQSTEVFILLLACLIVWPDAVFLNRGNHEDFNVNIRYGFIKEIMYKYTRHATKIIQVIEDVYSWLPLATLVDHRVFIVHGGISDKTDLKILSSLDRHQFIDVLWSDPRPMQGCHPNGVRGGGCFFGPDVTEAFLRRHRLNLLIRSHECKQDGYEYVHNNKVLTIFSASNYYDEGTNKGAYINLMGKDLEPHIVMFVSTREAKKTAFKPRRGVIEESALRELKQHIVANQTLLKAEFAERDPENTGKLPIHDWCTVMEKVVSLNLPWRLLCPQIANCDTETNTVEYNSTFDQYSLTNQLAVNGPSILEALYRNKETLETIFRIMDKDGSGLISMDEFSDACNILSKHANTPMSPEDIKDLAKSIDINKDGYIDFNEFLEAFRLVNKNSSENQVDSNGGLLSEWAQQCEEKPEANGTQNGPTL